MKYPYREHKIAAKERAKLKFNDLARIYKAEDSIEAFKVSAALAGATKWQIFRYTMYYWVKNTMIDLLMYGLICFILQSCSIAICCMVEYNRSCPHYYLPAIVAGIIMGAVPSIIACGLFYR